MQLAVPATPLHQLGAVTVNRASTIVRNHISGCVCVRVYRHSTLAYRCVSVCVPAVTVQGQLLHSVHRLPKKPRRDTDQSIITIL